MMANFADNRESMMANFADPGTNDMLPHLA
jgi:hypothetical protein